MKKVLILSLFMFAVAGFQSAQGQDYSNKGKDFWVIYLGHIDGTTSRLALYISSDQNATGTMSVNGSVTTFSVTANQVTTLRLTSTSNPANSVALNTQVAGVGTNKGIHIVTDNPVVVYAHELNAARSGSTLVLPTNVLGREYYVASYASTASNNNSKSEFAICATEDNTTVEITPKQADANNGHPANVPFQVTLNKGDVYQYQSANSGDLTGSYIKSISANNAPCKPISVFAGSTWTAMGCANAGSGDNLYQQMFPLVAWGQTYITAPFLLRSYDIFRIMVKDPATVVSVNGTPLPLSSLINNAYYEINTIGNNTPRIITSTIPVCVFQYVITMNCDNNNVGDPEMIALNPIEQTLTSTTVLSARNDLTPPNTNITRHFLNIITKTANLSSLKIDGAAPVALPVAIANTAYSYVREEVTASTLNNPTHQITSDSGFLAIAYGFGNVESYGYNAGTNVRDLYQYISIQNQYATVPFPAACKNAPFDFSIIFPYQPTSINWDFNGLFPNVTLTNPVYDQTFTVNGKQLYLYKLPNPYTITNTGSYPVKVTAQNPTPDGCSGTQEITYTLQVFDPPVADFIAPPVCFPNPVQFTDNSTTGGRPVIQRYWEFGDNTTGNSYNPTHTYSTAGSYTARYALITDVGCLSDTTSRTVTVNPLPTASLSGNTTVCKDDASPNITFTGASGTAPYTFTYTVNNGAPQTVTSTSGNSATVAVPTNTAGTFVYSLVSVSDGTSTHCSQNQSGSVTVTVNPLPTASIAGSTTVCKDAAAPNVVFTGAGSTAPYTFTYRINGGSPVQVSTTSGNSVSVPVSTSAPGTYVYELLNVSDGASTHCGQTQTGSVTITVNPLPVASIAGTIQVCRNTAEPQITFTGGNSTAPYTFTYKINNGAPQTVTSTGNTATVNVPTNVAGVFTYTLLSVQDASSTACVQAQSGSATVTVWELPAPAFNFSGPDCEKGIVNFTDVSVHNASSLTAWSWDFGDAGSGSNTASTATTSHVYQTAGTYTVGLIVTNDHGCVNPLFTRNVIVHPKPLAGYILPDVCLNDTYAQFNDTSRVANPDLVSGWNWVFGDPGSGVNNGSTLQNPQHSYTATGAYVVTLDIVTNQGCRDTVTQNLYVNGSYPVANFNALNATTMCANDTVAIKDASTVFPGNITKVEIFWDNVGAPTVSDIDDYPVAGRVYKHKYPNFQSPLTKTYSVRYLAYSGVQCVNEVTKTVTVNAAPLVQFVPLNEVCLDKAPFQITAATEIGNVPGAGVFSGPGVSAAGIFSPALAGPGVHTLKYKFTGTGGGCADSATQSIHVLDPPVANMQVVAPYCENKNILFTQNSTTPEGTLTNWIWDFGDGSLVPNNNVGTDVMHSYATWGTFDASIKVITSKGCVSTPYVVRVNVHPLPHPDFSFPASLCLPAANAVFRDLTTIADGTQSQFSWSWDFGDPASGTVNFSTAQNPSHTYYALTPVPVKLQVTSADGCVASVTKTVSTFHAQPQAKWAADPAGVCVGKPFSFTDISDQQGGTAQQWNWDLGDGAVRTTPAVQYTYAAAGTYHVTLYTYNNFGCRSNDFNDTVIVYPYPKVDAGPDRLVLEGGNIVLHPVVSGNDLTFLWTPNTYFAGSNTIETPTVNGVADITYLLTVTARGGCADTSSVFVKVLKFPTIPNIFSPNGDGVHDKWIIGYLDSYPGCTVDIYNRYGQLIFHSVGYDKPWDGTINGRPAPLGTYYYIVDPKNGRKQMAGYVDLIR